MSIKYRLYHSSFDKITTKFHHSFMLTPNLSFDTMEEILRLKIAGSSDGIGAQTAFQFATEGANVTITGRRAQNLEVEKF